MDLHHELVVADVRVVGLFRRSDFLDQPFVHEVDYSSAVEAVSGDAGEVVDKQTGRFAFLDLFEHFVELRSADFVGRGGFHE